MTGPSAAMADEEPELLRVVPKAISRFRACCVTHAPVGFAVTPRR
jgi:hypothetical protein